MIDMPISDAQRRIRRVALGDFVHRSALKFAGRTAVVDGDLRLSYAELDARSSHFAHHLLTTLGTGKQVGMLCQNSADMVWPTTASTSRATCGCPSISAWMPVPSNSS